MARHELLAEAAACMPEWEIARVIACSSAAQVLRVRPDATGEQARAAYRRLVVRIHPDKNPAAKGVGRANHRPSRLICSSLAADSSSLATSVSRRLTFSSIRPSSSSAGARSLRFSLRPSAKASSPLSCAQTSS
mmetsp:Transcript_4265/g.10315  ORF Transcript_4265/g.10315 Transcript_4265/m.10315 type:complete len:134 (-) Transcript_4265:163-564(-)